MNVQVVMKTRLLTHLTLVLFCLGALQACGSSEAYYAVQDEPGDTLPPDGKADSPVDEQFSMSGTSLNFEGEGYDGTIVLNSSAEISDSFGKGATACRHTVMLGGLTIDWEGSKTTVWARERSGAIEGKWQRAELEVEDGGSYKVRVVGTLGASSFDVYFEEPEALDFVLIQPVEPAN